MRLAPAARREQCTDLIHPSIQNMRPDLHTEVRALEGDAYLLCLDGVLWPGWAGNLASALAARGVSVQRGLARAARGGIWTARFEVLRLPGAPELAALDLEALAREDAHEGFATPLRIDRFAVVPALEHGGSLHLSVGAADAVGFLAALLRRLAYLSLFPVEMRLETQGDRVADELWLRAGGSRRPSRAKREVLSRALGMLVDSYG